MYLPIMELKDVNNTPRLNVEIVEVNPEHMKKNMLEVFYANLDCSLVEKVNLTDDLDFIIDEQGLFKNHKYGVQFPNYPNQFKDNVFTGKCTFVKVVERNEGCKGINKCWQPFENPEEIMDIQKKYFDKVVAYLKENNSNLN